MTAKGFPVAPAQAGAEEIRLACLRVGLAFYALDIMGIREIIRPLPIVPVPHAPACVDGVISLRKAVIPVVDLRRRFGLEPRKEPRERMVICAVDGRIVGLIVDEVTEVATFERDEIQPAPYFMADPDTEFFPGVCRYKGKLLLLVNLRQILGSDRQIDAVQIQEQALGTAVKD